MARIALYRQLCASFALSSNTSRIRAASSTGIRSLVQKPPSSLIIPSAMSTDSNNDANKKPKLLQAAQFPGDELWKEEWKPSYGEATIQRRSATSTTDAAQFTLYSSWFCPFAQRAWIVAEEIDRDYQWVEINPYEVDPNKEGGYTKLALPLPVKQRRFPGFVETSPRGLIPAVSHRRPAADPNNDTTKDDDDLIRIWESLPTAEYLDATFGGGTLAGRDPHERALVQIWSAHCTDRVQKQYYKALMTKDKTSPAFREAMEQYYEECRSLARAMMTKDDGPYFLGRHFSLVDVALAPFWQRMIWVGGHYMDLQFPPDEPEFDRLQKWWEAVQRRPSVRNTLVCKERLIASYNDYNQGAATSDFAKTMN